MNSNTLAALKENLTYQINTRIDQKVKLTKKLTCLEQELSDIALVLRVAENAARGSEKLFLIDWIVNNVSDSAEMVDFCRCYAEEFEDRL